MDLHGSLELMVFDDHLKTLETMEPEEPVAITISISKTEQFTRINAKKILPLSEAKGQKISLKKEAKKEVAESAVPNLIENLIVSIGVERDSEIIDKLYQLALECPGSKRLVLKIEGEKESVKMETNVMVSDTLLQKLRQIGQNTQRVA